MLHSICQQIWKTQQWPQDWKRSVFIPIPKKGNAKECSNYCTIELISHASKVISMVGIWFYKCNLDSVLNFIWISILEDFQVQPGYSWTQYTYELQHLFLEEEWQWGSRWTIILGFCQRMLKLLHNWTYLTHKQSNAQNSTSQASTLCELWPSRCSSWI